jgi:DNA-binding transcriptional LysR family regulator
MGNTSVSKDVQLPHLETFSKVADLGSFTAAAKLLHLTQAAVSQRIQNLEQAVGKSLFQRAGGRVMLTEAGRTLFDYAQRILELHSEVRAKISGQQTSITGELVIGASSIPGEHILPALLSVFRKTHPLIQVRASISDSMTVVKQVERGEVNFGLVGRKTDSPHLDFRFLAKDRMVLVVPPGHELCRHKRIGLNQFCRQPMILREAGSGLRHSFETALERAGKSPNDLTIALELGSNEAIKGAVLQGVGIAILSAYAVQKELETGQLKAIKVTNLSCDRDMFVVQDKRRAVPLPARQFLTFLEANPVERTP